MNRDGRGVDPGEDTTPNLGYFFKLIFRKFSNLITLNLMMFAMALPIAVAVYVFFNGPQMPTMSSPAYSALMGAQLAGAGGGELLTKLMHILPNRSNGLTLPILRNPSARRLQLAISPRTASAMLETAVIILPSWQRWPVVIIQLFV